MSEMGVIEYRRSLACAVINSYLFFLEKRVWCAFTSATSVLRRFSSDVDIVIDLFTRSAVPEMPPSLTSPDLGRSSFLVLRKRHGGWLAWKQVACSASRGYHLTIPAGVDHLPNGLVQAVQNVKTIACTTEEVRSC